MYTCIVVDDEKYAIDEISEYIHSLSTLKLIKTYSDPIQALNEILAGEKVDLIFMDVDMPGMTGVELSQTIRQKTDKLIFTTAHSKYAFNAFEVSADAFLLKPFSLAKFATTVNKVLPAKTSPKPSVTEDPHDFFFVKDKNNLKLIKIRYQDMIAVESLGNYVQIHTAKDKVIAYLSLQEVNVLLQNNNNFVQVQRSFIISKNNIESIDGNIIKMSNELLITMGGHYKERLASFIKAKTIKTNRK
ncbi:two-component system response regulator [Pedobacter sp. BAL39]|uniref:LytR/AlgR family response regulator transcription factor n=1 Tax=Pedobacter sp. BAL39 TaxID=391596 RepID=UPI0001559BD1|nr:LytTR family DNA-binding domain-containing protein [Pedobacter sp. BAL39]EDM36718.1 two-component system response regulator [Pedobacter sp. BAL39]